MVQLRETTQGATDEGASLSHVKYSAVEDSEPVTAPKCAAYRRYLYAALHDIALLCAAPGDDDASWPATTSIALNEQRLLVHGAACGTTVFSRCPPSLRQQLLPLRLPLPSVLQQNLLFPPIICHCSRIAVLEEMRTRTFSRVRKCYDVVAPILAFQPRTFSSQK